MIDILENVLDDNKILYLNVNITLNDNEFDIDLKSYSKYFKENLLIQEDIQLSLLVREILESQNTPSESTFLSKDNKTILNTYIKVINSYCNINIYPKCKNEYYIIINIQKQEKNTLNNDKKVLIHNSNKIKGIKTKSNQTEIDLIANLSHEFRTPINLISSASQVLSLKLGDLDNDKKLYFTKYIDIINRNVFRLLKLVNKFIDVAKIESKQFNHNPKNNDIVNFIEDICLSISEYAKHNGMEIIFDTDTEEKFIHFDADNMEVIILNLLSNAIKFNKPNEKIYVTIECNNNVNISVKDNGIGICNNKLDDIFKRFEQIKNTSKNEKEGSGIGLFLVKSLVEMHHGQIEVKSELDKGSEFIITLPNISVNEGNYIKAEHINRTYIELSDWVK